MGRTITLRAMGRVEGHGRIHIFLDEHDMVRAARLDVPEFKGFESFCVGRHAEEMPSLTAKICGVCPTAHHLASAKALDALFQAPPPPAAAALREYAQCAFFVEDHLLHFYVLGGADFLSGEAPGGDLLRVAERLGTETVRRVLDARQEVRQAVSVVLGSVTYPTAAVAGGLSKGITSDEAATLRRAAEGARALAAQTLELFVETVLPSPKYRALAEDARIATPLLSLGLVDAEGRPNFYDGVLRVVDPEGGEVARFGAGEAGEWLGETPCEEGFGKFTYLKSRPWSGVHGGAEGGIYRVGPLARLTVARGMATPAAHEAYLRWREHAADGGMHHPLSYHWARLIEALYGAERMIELASDPKQLQGVVNSAGAGVTRRARGVVEAPRGTLIHAYDVDDAAILTGVDLIVATQNNLAPISIALERAAGTIDWKQTPDAEGLARLGSVVRSFDPCFACSTHRMEDAPGERVIVHRAGRPPQILRAARSKHNSQGEAHGR